MDKVEAKDKKIAANSSKARRHDIVIEEIGELQGHRTDNRSALPIGSARHTTRAQTA